MESQQPLARQLRQIAGDIRALPEALKFSPGDVSRQAARLLDAAMAIGAFSGPEYARLRILTRRAKDSGPRWESAFWMEATACLTPELHHLGPVGRCAPACEPIADLLDQEAIKLENLKNETSESNKSKAADSQDGGPAPARPPDKAFKAWYARDVSGISIQREIAEEMTRQGIPATQGQVSKWLSAVDKYLKAGGIIPTVQELNSQPQAIDPAVLDMGKRQDGRTPRQRPRRNSDDK